jgi:hypothetical protein
MLIPTNSITLREFNKTLRKALPIVTPYPAQEDEIQTVLQSHLLFEEQFYRV